MTTEMTILLAVLAGCGLAALLWIGVLLIDEYISPATDSERANRDVEKLIRQANRPKRRAF